MAKSSLGWAWPWAWASAYSSNCEALVCAKVGEKKSYTSRPLTSVSLQICPEIYLTEHMRARNILSKAASHNKWLPEHQLPYTTLLKGKLLQSEQSLARLAYDDIPLLLSSYRCCP